MNDGFELRSYAGPEDLPDVVRLTNRSWAADGVEHVTDLASTTTAHARAADFDPERQVVLARSAAAAVGFVRVRHWRQDDGTRVYAVAAHVDPDRRSRGIGTALLQRAETLAGELSAADAGEGPRVVESYLFDAQRAARALLESRGYATVPELELQDMVRPSLTDLPEAPLPAGLALRPAGPEHRRAAWELLEAAGVDYLNSRPGTEEDFERWAALPFWDESLWRLAWDGDRLVGMVLSYILPAENATYRRRRGYTEYVNVARDWRRRGVATALLVEGMRALAERGMTEAALDVDVHSPSGARRVYERLGYQRVRSLLTYRRTLVRRDPASGAG